MGEQITSLYAGINADIFNAFAEPFSLVREPQEIAVSGIFDAVSRDENLVGNLQFSDRRLEVQILNNDFAQLDIKRHESIRWRDKLYKILEIEHDLFGLTKLTLRM